MRCPFRYSLLFTAIMLAMINISQAEDSVISPASETQDAAEDAVQFDPIFLNTAHPDSVDLSRYSCGDAVLPGNWPTDIYVNDQPISHDNVLFVEQDNRTVIPCLTVNNIKKLNLDYARMPEAFNTALRSVKNCHSLEQLVPEITRRYDSGSQRLDYSIPQLMLQKTARGYVSPELWDHGVPAFMLGYNASTWTTRSHGTSYTSSYAGLNAGLNVGAWYFRHDGSYQWQEQGGSSYQSINNYVQRDIPAITGRVRIGETSTSGQLFDSIPFRGVELVNDDRMLPQSQRGYAPDIRGVARTNARVKIRQNGRLIYETTVSPGAFAITELYPTGYGGNLQVTVTEADGSEQQFEVPYASVTQLLRLGAHHYNVVYGRLNDPSLSFNPSLYQATYRRGLTNILTGYGGVQGSDAKYYALQLGLAASTPIGAFSADVTQARAHLNHDASSGQSYQVSYSKFLPSTNSNLTIAAYRFSTSGYYDYLTAMRAVNEERQGSPVINIWRPKNRFNITMNQGLPTGWGQLYLTGYTQDYWNHDNSDLQYQLGYSNNVGVVNFNLSAGRVRNQRGQMENNWLLNLSLPLGSNENRHVPRLNASVNRNSNGRMGEQLGISGTQGDDNQFSYGMNASRYNQGGSTMFNTNGGWRTQYSNLMASYGTGQHHQNMSVGASGTAIVWPGGAVATPYNGDTFAVVEAKNAKGAKVSGYPGIKIDRWGHAAVPYLNPYEMNEIAIDPKGIDWDVELANTTEKVAPHAGAVTKVVFDTQQGTPLLITARRRSGEPVPFGADVLDASNNQVGSVGQMGQAWVRTEQDAGTLKIVWGSASDQQCVVTYNVSGKKATGITPLTADCK